LSEPTPPVRGSKGAALESLKRDVVDHYERQLRRHGPTARGMDWKDEASQELRFALLCEVADLEGRSVAEIGCGAGHLADFLQRRGIEAHYFGFDLSEEMVAAAKGRRPELRFQCLDILRDPLPEQYDVVLCSGLFHVKLDREEGEWREFVHEMLRRMYEASRLAIAFNLMTDQVDFRSPDLYYSAPGETLDFCRTSLSRFVALRHDYPLYEYTTYVFREPSR
jgi:SAM-dependent methyltransferase